MTFFSHISSSIALISQESFKNNQILCSLNPLTALFLYKVISSIFPENSFSLLTENLAVRGSIISVKITGLKMIKTDYNSLENQLDPAFIATLKKVISVLFSNLISLFFIKSSPCTVLTASYRLFTIQKNCHYLPFYTFMLQQVISFYQLKSKLIVKEDPSTLSIIGIEGDLKTLFQALKQEATTSQL